MLERCYHRRGLFDQAAAAAGAPDGIRLFLNCCFHQVQKWGDDLGEAHDSGAQGSIPQGLAEAWLAASVGGNGGAALTLGGRWSAASIWAAMEEARQRDPAVAALLEDTGRAGGGSRL